MQIFGEFSTEKKFTLPIIENGPDLEDKIKTSLTTKAPAILVRNHGLFVCGTTKEITIKRVDALETLFEYEVKKRDFKSSCTIL